MTVYEKVRDRWLLWLMDELAEDEHCRRVGELYRRRLAGDEPSREEWMTARAAAEWAAVAVAAAEAAVAVAAAAEWAAVAVAVSWKRSYAALIRIASEEGVPLTVEGLHGKVWGSVRDDPARLDMDRWHSCETTCETTHCRGGWAIVHSGEHARDLEKLMGSRLVAGAVYLASTGEVPDFHTTDKAALKDIQRCAEGQA